MRHLAALLVATGTGCACQGSAPPAPLQPVVTLAPTGLPEVDVRVELAQTDAERVRGLMYRTELAADAGMLFVFPFDAEHSFWMKNTYIPLDMIFIGSDLRVVGVVADAEPLTTTSRTCGLPSRYVLEINAGLAARHGITPGTAVRWQHFAPQAR